MAWCNKLLESDSQHGGTCNSGWLAVKTSNLSFYFKLLNAFWCFYRGWSTTFCYGLFLFLFAIRLYNQKRWRFEQVQLPGLQRGDPNHNSQPLGRLRHFERILWIFYNQMSLLSLETIWSKLEFCTVFFLTSQILCIEFFRFLRSMHSNEMFV